MSRATTEAVARIIDPMIFRVLDLGNGLSDEGAKRIDAAIAKADAILKALAPPMGEAVPVAWRYREDDQMPWRYGSAFTVGFRALSVANPQYEYQPLYALAQPNATETRFKCSTCHRAANPAHFCDQHEGGPWCDDCWKVGDCAETHGDGCQTTFWDAP